MKKNLLKHFFVALLVLFCGVNVNAQKVEGNKLVSWDGASGSIKIPDGVTEIAENCFYTQDEGGEDGWGGGETISNTQITNIDFNQVTTIGKNAFKGCTGITTLTATHVQTINEEAFDGCSSIKTLSLPAVVTIGKNAFANCEQLNTVSLGASLTTITANPFANCAALHEFVVDPSSTHFMADNGALLRKSDGTLVSFPCSLTEYTASSEVKKLGEYSFKNCSNLVKLNLPSVSEIGEGAFSGCSSLTELLIPHLQKVNNAFGLTFNGVGNLKIVDVHLNPRFEGFGRALPDKESTTVYVKNESVQQKLQEELKRAKIVVGEPNAVKRVKVNYVSEGRGALEAWTLAGTDVKNDSYIAQGSKLSVKAMPLFDHEAYKWTVNGEDKTAQVKGNILEIESVNEDINIVVHFRKTEEGAYIFFRSVSPAMGSITCTKEDGTKVLSATKVRAGEKLTFTATPRRGYRITNWQREKKNVATAEYDNLTDYYAKQSITLDAEDAMDIQVDFDRIEGYCIVKFASFNTKTGTLTAKNETDNTVLNSGEALPKGSKIVFTAQPQNGNVVDEWQLNGNTILNYKSTTYTVENLQSDVEVNMVCSELKEETPAGAIIKNGHLIEWKPVGDAVLPSSVTHIDAHAFEGAMQMTSLTLNDRVEKVSYPAFLYCVSLKEFKVPATNQHFTSVNGVLYSKDKNTLVSYPNGRTDASYTIPATTQNVQPAAFTTAPALTSVKVEDGNSHLTSVGGVLYDAQQTTLLFYPAQPTKEKAKEIALKEGLTTLAPYALTHHTALEKITLPQSLKEIKDNALCYNPKLTVLNLEEGSHPALSFIGENAFKYCRNLDELPYFSMLKTISKNAFSTCTQLSTIHIPAGCKLEKDAFEKCQNLHSVYAYDDTPATIDPNMFTDIVFINEARLIVPLKSGQLYSTQTGWNVFAGHVIEELPTGIVSVENMSVTLKNTPNGVAVDGLQAGLRYALYTANGVLVTQGVSTTAPLTLTLQKGLHVLKIEKVGTLKCMK